MTAATAQDRAPITPPRRRARPHRSGHTDRQAARPGQALGLHRRASRHKGTRYGRGRRLQHGIDGARGSPERRRLRSKSRGHRRAREDAVRGAAETPGGKNIVSLARPFDDPLPADVRDLDLITFLFFYHDTTYMPVDRAEMNRKLYAALKPGGMLVIADHSAKPGDGTSVGKSLHRIEESALRREVEAADSSSSPRRFLAPPRGCARLLIQPPSGKAVDEFVLKFQSRCEQPPARAAAHKISIIRSSVWSGFGQFDHNDGACGAAAGIASILFHSVQRPASSWRRRNPVMKVWLSYWSAIHRCDHRDNPDLTASDAARCGVECRSGAGHHLRAPPASYPTCLPPRLLRCSPVLRCSPADRRWRRPMVPVVVSTRSAAARSRQN